MVEGDTRCNLVSVRSGSPGRMRNRKKFRTSTKNRVPRARSAFPLRSAPGSGPVLRAPPSHEHDDHSHDRRPDECQPDLEKRRGAARATGSLFGADRPQVQVAFVGESVGNLALVGIGRGPGPAPELTGTPGLELVVVVEDYVRVVLVGDALHLLDGLGPLV